MERFFTRCTKFFQSVISACGASNCKCSRTISSIFCFCKESGTL
ncbi:conserved hypothetical protein [Listeria innocua FSL S4-378]|nr:conserved hypothetical protein [Listeria innocua FSL S4-378]